MIGKLKSLLLSPLRDRRFFTACVFLYIFYFSLRVLFYDVLNFPAYLIEHCVAVPAYFVSHMVYRNYAFREGDR